MDNDERDLTKKKCPYCAELILKEAVKCRYCQSELMPDKGKDKPATLSLGRAALLNLICPGYGAWYLGYRLRGTVVFVAILGSIFYYAHLAVPIINKKVTHALQTGQTQGLYSLEKDLEGNPWL